MYRLILKRVVKFKGLDSSLSLTANCLALIDPLSVLSLCNVSLFSVLGHYMGPYLLCTYLS